MKIITFSAIKGGVGKTTLIYNFSEWLAKNGDKILLIDFDHQCNLSSTYNIYDTDETVKNIFTREGNVKIHKVSKNVDLIAGYIRLDEIEKSLENDKNKDMMFYLWLKKNYTDLQLGQYNYIIIDCHSDFSTATKNAVITSHFILSPITPSEFGYNAKFNLSARVEALKKESFDYKTGESFVTAEILFIGNMIKKGNNSSDEMLEAIKDDKQIVEVIPSRELFNKSTIQKKTVFDIKPKETELLKKLEIKFKNIRKYL